MPRAKPKKSILWICYGAAAFVFLILQSGFFSRITVYGAGPIILPVCVVVAAVFEGGINGALYGLFCGLLMDSISSDFFWFNTLFMPVFGLAVGQLASYTSRGALLSCILWSLAALVLTAIGQLFQYAFILGYETRTVLLIAAAQTVYSLVFSIPIYYLFRMFHKRLGDD